MGLIKHILRSTINVVSTNNIICKFVSYMTNLTIWIVCEEYINLLKTILISAIKQLDLWYRILFDLYKASINQS